MIKKKVELDKELKIELENKIKNNTEDKVEINKDLLKKLSGLDEKLYYNKNLEEISFDLYYIS
ncbi:hypothetical protein HOG21_03240 [bacterium]|jgi:hypothetical protein|nr:hypothetical protein [bacterium]